MPCTTILVGKNASYDGSTIIARNDDSGAGSYTPKKYVVVKPEEQPRIYKSEISHVEIELPDDPMRYTCVPNALAGEGCRTDFADIQNKKECGGNRQWQNHYLRNWAANTKGKAII